jgi:putative transposase
MAKKELKKSRRRKSWVRYERNHSLSAVHMDWLYDEQRGKNVIAVIDDASRMILAYGEFDHATVENSILVLKKALKYGKIREVITDRGSQFTANKIDKKGEHKSKFAEFCKSQEIKQILCRVKHPQSNGKIERWFGLYRQKRNMYDSLQDFVYWYNQIKPHLSLNFDELETPIQAFRRKFKS